jgi:Protein of unknown function (DUF4446)
MDDLTTTTGIVALAAGGVAVVALLLALVLAVKLRRLRSNQKLVLGDERRDIVGHAGALQRDFAALNAYVEDAMGRLHGRLDEAERRLDGSIAHRSLVRYDAYNEMSGQQSTSIALLDARRSGVVLTSIHHRDQARMYAKLVREGQAELQLSPEEDEAVRAALDGRDTG